LTPVSIAYIVACDKKRAWVCQSDLAVARKVHRHRQCWPAQGQPGRAAEQ
jgi:hypothetical protein